MKPVIGGFETQRQFIKFELGVPMFPEVRTFVLRIPGFSIDLHLRQSLQAKLELRDKAFKSVRIGYR